MKKAQLSMEFLFSLGTVFLVFIILLFIIIDKQIELSNSKETLEKLSECQRFANLITSVASSNEGTVAEFKTKYYVSVTDSGSIYVNDENTNLNEVACTYVANPINEDFYGNVRLEKKDGIVDVD